MREKSDVVGAIIANLHEIAPINVSKGSFVARIHKDHDWREKIGGVSFNNFPIIHLLDVRGVSQKSFDARDPDFFEKLAPAVLNLIRNRSRVERYV